MCIHTHLQMRARPPGHTYTSMCPRMCASEHTCNVYVYPLACDKCTRVYAICMPTSAHSVTCVYPCAQATHSLFGGIPEPHQKQAVCICRGCGAHTLVILDQRGGMASEDLRTYSRLESRLPHADWGWGWVYSCVQGGQFNLPLPLSVLQTARVSGARHDPQGPSLTVPQAETRGDTGQLPSPHRAGAGLCSPPQPPITDGWAKGSAEGTP